ncbi:NlpC/P60 family protein [Alkalicoccus urumqiensis]
MPSMNIGDRSSFVRTLQQTLAEKGHNPSSNIDGIFGAETLKAVRSYQLVNGISNPNGNFYGTAGPQTLGSLGFEHTRGPVSAASLQTSAPPLTMTAGRTETAPSASMDADALLTSAQRYLGTPYVWGGTTTSGMDCSGFVQKVMKEHGVELPRTTAQMWAASEPVSSPQKGDLVFFETRSGPSHVGIYMGGDKFIHAGASTGVTETDMNNPYWSERYLGAKRPDTA